MIHHHKLSQMSSNSLKPAHNRYHAPVNYDDVNQIRAKIIKEIISIDTEMRKNTSESQDAAFSMRETWKTMIDERKQLLRKFAVALD